MNTDNWELTCECQYCQADEHPCWQFLFDRVAKLEAALKSTMRTYSKFKGSKCWTIEDLHKISDKELAELAMVLIDE